MNSTPITPAMGYQAQVVPPANDVRE